MEERCDWGVSIQPPHGDDLAVLAPPTRKKTPPTHTATDHSPSHHTHTHTATDHSPSHHTHIPSDAPIRKQHSAPAGQKGGAKKVLPPRAEPQGGGGGASSDVSRQRVQESLPKIPPLPSFKPRRSKPISLQGATLDFQQFITEGPGRAVEVVRQFGVRGADPQGDVSKGEELREERFLLHDEQPSSSSQRRMRAVTTDHSSSASTSGSPSPSPSSSSESDMEEAEPKAPALLPQNLPERSSRHHTTRQPARPIKAEPTCAVPAPKHPPSQSRPSAARHPSQSPQPSRPPQAQARSSAAPTQRGGSSRGRARRPAPLEEEEPQEEEEPEEEGEGQDYWGRTYAQAWRQYYKSLPPSYRHAYSSSHAWMAAYRMSSVYMQEMMKP